ncbi:MAG: SpoIIE family protein phosphatase [Actinobacteria bacterium]|nr:SpoIIE family protein phosphatase [Actinomycetota bacterium]
MEATGGEQTSWALDEWAVLDVLPRAIVVADPDGTIRHWSRGAEDLFGWAAGEVIGRSALDVLVPPADRPLGAVALAEIAAGASRSGDATLLRRDGQPIRVNTATLPIHAPSGEVVALVGASEDVGEQRLLEQRTQDLTEHLQLALEAGGLGTWRWDLASGITDWDERLEALFGLPPGGFDGTYDAWVGLLHPDDRDEVLAELDRAVAEKRRYRVHHRVVWPDGTVRWLSGSGEVTVDAAGNVTGTIGCTGDITDQVNAQQERERLTHEALAAADAERAARERLEFVGRVNDVLAASNTRDDIMREVVHVAVPRLGDWCTIHVLPDDGSRVPDVAIAHRDPAMVEHARDLLRRFPYDPDSPIGVAQVIRSGRASFTPELGADQIRRLPFRSPEEAEATARLGLHSVIVVPLVKRGRILGAIRFAMTDSGRHYTEDDLALAEAVAARIAASLENRRLSERHRTIAAELQAGLLAEAIPEVPGADIAVRYWAAGEGMEVGGDFYDVFPVLEDQWAAVIGDVCGKGPAAATVTGMARHTIATSAWHGDDPVEVLAHLNRTMRYRRSDSFCTAVYATIRPEVGGIAAGLTCAGHPLPIVARADGTVAAVGRTGTLLGVYDDIDVHTDEVHLGPGDALVLYTDGISDVRPPANLDATGVQHLIGRAAAGARSADELLDAMLRALTDVMPIERRSDDIALLAIRVPA